MYNSQILEIEQTSFITDKKEEIKGIKGKIILLGADGLITAQMRPFWVSETSEEDFKNLLKAKVHDVIEHAISYDGKKVTNIKIIKK